MLHVTCAIIERDGLILAAQRRSEQAHGGLWEFPGGKVEPGETHEACLRREIQEELAMDIDILVAWPALTHHYPEKNLDLCLWPFRCRWRSGEPQLLAHQALRWLPPAALASLAWSAADQRLLAQL
jgi:8-oxo-dGTP diphosphatase